LVFTGTYEHTIDAKNRLAIPAEVRVLLRRQQQGCEALALYVTRGEGQSLCLYTEAGFEQRAGELDRSQLDTEKLLAYERLMFSLARRVEVDEQGRVRLPDQLLKMVNLPQDVVLLGVKDRLEIRGREAWYQDMEKTLAEQPQIFMNFRRAIRGPGDGTDKGGNGQGGGESRGSGGANQG
jgi:MraZ protein